MRTVGSISEKSHDTESLLNYHCERSYHSPTRKASTSSELLADIYFSLHLAGVCLREAFV